MKSEDYFGNNRIVDTAVRLVFVVFARFNNERARIRGPFPTVTSTGLT